MARHHILLVMEEMDAQTRRRLMHEGAAAFRRGEFYEAHELWEEVWDVADDPDRRFIQGMIQLATGLHKLARGRSDLTLGLFERAFKKLEDAPAELDGL